MKKLLAMAMAVVLYNNQKLVLDFIVSGGMIEVPIATMYLLSFFVCFQWFFKAWGSPSVVSVALVYIGTEQRMRSEWDFLFNARPDYTLMAIVSVLIIIYFIFRTPKQKIKAGEYWWFTSVKFIFAAIVFWLVMVLFGQSFLWEISTKNLFLSLASTLIQWFIIGKAIIIVEDYIQTTIMSMKAQS
jgi:hypothetical protein